ncbi:MAG TPA: hypothetical protein VJO53_10630 [Candidatus Acidoferrales bacterium]|nr:hypothetical protein [Candidatus Acidoferrales bacterium]
MQRKKKRETVSGSVSGYRVNQALRFMVIYSGMRVLTLLPILLLLHSHPSCEAQQSSTAGVTQTEKVIGPFDLSLDLSSARRETLLVEIRAFLWDNLVDHQPAEVKVKFYTVEGDPTEWAFSVVTVGGRWCIRGDYVHTTSFGLKPSQKPQVTKGKKDYCDVMRVDARTEQAIPRAEQRNPETYRLQLDRSQNLTL